MRKIVTRYFPLSLGIYFWLQLTLRFYMKLLLNKCILRDLPNTWLLIRWGFFSPLTPLLFGKKLGHRTSRLLFLSTPSPLVYYIHVYTVYVYRFVILIACCIVCVAHAWRRRVLLSCRPLLAIFLPQCQVGHDSHSWLFCHQKYSHRRPHRHVFYSSFFFFGGSLQLVGSFIG